MIKEVQSENGKNPGSMDYPKKMRICKNICIFPCKNLAVSLK